MARLVVRVRIPEVRVYDVVFDDGAPIFVGAVIPRPAGARDPQAGQLVDRHRTTWDARGSGSWWSVQAIVAQAQDQLTTAPAAPDLKLPAQVDRAHSERLVGRPHDAHARAVHRRRAGKA